MTTCQKIVPAFHLKCEDLNYDFIQEIQRKLVSDIMNEMESRIIERFKTISIYFADKKDFYDFLKENCTMEFYQETGEHNLYLHGHNYLGEKLLVANWNDNFEVIQDGNTMTINYNI